MKISLAIKVCAILSLFLSFNSHSQPNNQEKTERAKRFEPSLFVNITDAYALNFESDGKTLYVTAGLKSGGGFYTSRLKKGKWGALEKIEFSSGEFNDNDLFPAPDGSGRFFFMTLRGDQKRPQNIWTVEKKGKKWSNPYEVKNVNSEARDGFPSITNSNEIYFFSGREGGFGSADIYSSQLENGEYQKPKNVGASVNTEFWDGLPYVTPNGKVMIFFSNRPDGFGDGDLYVSYKIGDEWSEPENLGPNVNTELTEVTPSIGPDQRKLYFSRLVEIDGVAGRRIFVIDIEDTPIDQNYLD